MNDSSNIVEAGVHNLQPWYPPLAGLYGPRNTLVVKAKPETGMTPTRNAIPAPLTVPYYRYHLSPLFPACARGNAFACRNIYGDFITSYNNDKLHGSTDE